MVAVATPPGEVAMLEPRPSTPRSSPLAGALVCTSCGARRPLDAASLELAREEVARTVGFELQGGSLVLSGRCASCRSDRWGRA
jgi:Fe2+ or Zn2+ uptake regulation protein